MVLKRIYKQIERRPMGVVRTGVAQCRVPLGYRWTALGFSTSILLSRLISFYCMYLKDRKNCFVCIFCVPCLWCIISTGTFQTVERLAAVRESYPGEGEIFCIRPDRPCGPSSLLYNPCQVSFPRVSLLVCGVNYLPHLVLRLKKEESYGFTSLVGLHGLFKGEFYVLSLPEQFDG